MPMYEYACKECDHKFEMLVRSGSVLECPSCHSTQLEKLLSVFATTGDTTKTAIAMPGPCGSCGHPDGPGACGFQ
jgi:putative FmdB family regulatory protein